MINSTRKDAVRLRARMLVGAAAITLAALLFPVAAPAAQPGLSPDSTWGTSTGDQDRTAAALADVGSKWVRLNVEWSSTEPAPGIYNTWLLGHYDRAVSQARASGQKVLMLVSQSPAWASGSTNKQAAPINPATYASFLRFLASRWAGKVDAWEIWNEPNISRFWPTGPNPVAYTALLKASYTAIKSTDPLAKVVFGGPSLNDYGFIEGAYAAGAKGYFDIMAVHPYSCAKGPETISRDSSGRVTSNSFLGYREVRASMLARGDDKPIWLTELGWSTTTQQCGVSEATQADYLTRAFKLLEQDSYVQVAIWYNFRNNYWSGDSDDVEARYGLMRTDFSRKPSYDAFKNYATGAPAPVPAPAPAPAAVIVPPSSSPTSVNFGPVATLTSPAPGSVFSDRLTFSAVASDDKRVTKVEFWIDNRLVRTDASAPYSYGWTLSGAYKRLSWGQHTVTVKAFDAEGLVGTDTESVRRSKTAGTATASRAHSSKRASPRSQRHVRNAKMLSGRVHGATAGRVTLSLRKLEHGKWQSQRSVQAEVAASGAFRTRVDMPHGHWRVQASFSGAGRRASASSLRFKT